MPKPGEERYADDLLVSPGGGAITAIGAARLGLSVALAAPLGRDYAGQLIRSALAEDGVAWVGNAVERTPTTVVLPADGDRAFVTFDPADQLTAIQLAACEPRAATLGLGRSGSRPARPMSTSSRATPRHGAQAGSSRPGWRAPARCWPTSARP